MLKQMRGSAIVAGGLCLLGWKQGTPQDVPTDRSSPKAAVRSFVAAVTLKNSDAAAACVRGGHSGTALQTLLNSEGRPTAWVTKTEMHAMIAEADADHARVAAEMTLFIDPAVNPALPKDARLNLRVVEMFQLERVGSQWLIVPDADIEREIEKAHPQALPDAGLYTMRPLSAMAAMTALPDAGLKVVEQARQVTAGPACLSNEKQIAMGLLLYVQDHDSYPRRNASYAKLIAPYIKNADLFRCPLDAGGTVSYTFNAHLQGVSIIDIEAPAQTVLLYEGKNMQVDFRHDGRAAVTFVDGHAQLLLPDEAKNVYWYPAGKTPKPAAKPTVKSKVKTRH